MGNVSVAVRNVQSKSVNSIGENTNVPLTHASPILDILGISSSLVKLIQFYKSRIVSLLVTLHLQHYT